MRLGPVGWMIGIVVACSALTALIKTVANPWGSSSANPVAHTSTDSARANNEPIIRKPTQPALSPRDQYLEASRLLVEARLRSEQALEDIATWNSEILPILEQPESDNIAVNQDLVDKLAYVLEKKRTTENEVEIGLGQIEQMTRRVDQLSASDNAELLSAHELSVIRTLHSDARIASSAWDKAVKRALAIIRQSYRDVAPSGQFSLKEKVEQSTDGAILDALSDEQVNGPPAEEVDSRVSVGVFAPAVDPSIRESSFAADVKTTLAPFLENRTIQPRLSGAAIRFQNTSVAAPMSLSRLASMGALNNSIDGLKRLVAVGADRKLPEPKWHIHTMPNNWSEDDREFLKTAQTMLRDYGQLLVDEGLLSQ